MGVKNQHGSETSWIWTTKASNFLWHWQNPPCSLPEQAEKFAKHQKLKATDISYYSHLPLSVMLIDICCRYGETMLKEKKFPLVSYREPTERSAWMQLYYTDNLLHVLKGNNGLSCWSLFSGSGYFIIQLQLSLFIFIPMQMLSIILDLILDDSNSCFTKNILKLCLVPGKVLRKKN